MPENDFLKSALATSGAYADADIVRWLKSRAAENSCSIQRIPLQSLTGWIIDPGLGNLVHTSGKFFKVEGIDIRMNYGSEKCWSQPIINQPEIGILDSLAMARAGRESSVRATASESLWHSSDDCWASVSLCPPRGFKDHSFGFPKVSAVCE
jgi:hypothetical protein